jgi:hypothetical protein
MRFVVYVSAATRLMSDGELMSLLEVSRDRNGADGLTGMLLYKDGSFMQALEGEEGPLERTCGRILRDPRHSGLVFLRRGEIAARSFAGWAMGFRSVAAGELEAVPGFARLGDETFASPRIVAKPHLAVRLLKTFHDSTR